MPLPVEALKIPNQNSDDGSEIPEVLKVPNQNSEDGSEQPEPRDFLSTVIIMDCDNVMIANKYKSGC